MSPGLGTAAGGGCPCKNAHEIRAELWSENSSGLTQGGGVRGGAEFQKGGSLATYDRNLGLGTAARLAKSETCVRRDSRPGFGRIERQLQGASARKGTANRGRF